MPPRWQKFRGQIGFFFTFARSAFARSFVGSFGHSNVKIERRTEEGRKIDGQISEMFRVVPRSLDPTARSGKWDL